MDQRERYLACSACHGYGSVSYMDLSGWQEETCPDCKGSGIWDAQEERWLQGDVVCAECGAADVIWTSTPGTMSLVPLCTDHLPAEVQG